jgi:hypothetical protein
MDCRKYRVVRHFPESEILLELSFAKVVFACDSTVQRDANPPRMTIFLKNGFTNQTRYWKSSDC